MAKNLNLGQQRKKPTSGQSGTWNQDCRNCKSSVLTTWSRSLPCPVRLLGHTSGRNWCQSCTANNKQTNKEPIARVSKPPKPEDHNWSSWKDQTTASQVTHIFQSRSREFEASSRRWPSADPTTNGEAHVTRQEGVSSYEVESDGKSCIGNWKHLKKAADDAKSSHGIDNYAAPYIDLPINEPHQEEPTKHKEPNVSSKTTAITKQQSLTDCQTKEHVPKTRSGRISVPPARFKDFVRFQLDMMDLDSDFALIFFP